MGSCDWGRWPRTCLHNIEINPTMQATTLRFTCLQYRAENISIHSEQTTSSDQRLERRLSGQESLYSFRIPALRMSITLVANYSDSERDGHHGFYRKNRWENGKLRAKSRVASFRNRS